MTDVYDIAILREVQQNAKVTVKELSEKVNLSPTPVFERLKKLEKEGYITGYHARLNPKLLGLNLTVMCYVSLRYHQKDLIEIFMREVVCFPEVRECFHIAGMYDFLLRVMISDMDAYQHFVNHKLASMENIGNVQSAFVMSEIKSEVGIQI
jgi:Lrp/AsnC family transcriptional regulator, leucine-responsive regulatory protein